ncbi:MAG TPA: MarR family winged helix-turn-helix transcriptional regulator [Xanthobacteraceae bacterium]|nr:MarR family winged helix-turn-helix transcriptional regulator [Xanthobacteraceae bacterium]
MKPNKKSAVERTVLDLDRHIPYFFTYITNKLSSGASRLYRKHFGIGITEWRIMGVLAGAPDINANQICIKIGMDKAAISRSLQILEQQKLIFFTDTDDNRTRSISLTPGGYKVHDQIIQIALQRENLMVAKFTNEERRLFEKFLRHIRSEVANVNAWDPFEDAPAAKRKRSGQTG